VRMCVSPSPVSTVSKNVVTLDFLSKAYSTDHCQRGESERNKSEFKINNLAGGRKGCVLNECGKDR
jgi:hypothetical protein